MARPAQPPSLRVRVLGELEVYVDGAIRPLPRSRKVRALLAYLAVTGRPHRRDHLSELFWDVTDDRRAALRWSLTKLRRALDPDASGRLVATRDHVELTIDREQLDVDALRRAARTGLESQPTEALEKLATHCRGELLEGMLLPDFDAFEAWLEAERSEARALQARLRRALVERLEGEPARAFAHARAWARSGSDEAQAWVERLAGRLDGTPTRAPTETPTTIPPRPAIGLGPMPAPAAPSAPLVGRDAEMRRLCLIANEARAQRSGRVVLLVGEPGMGKTRLLEELRYALREPAPCVLDAVAHEVERNRPLAPFLDAARDALAAGPDASPDAPGLDREQLFEALGTLIRRGADEHGLGLLLVDDAHLCDPSSCELLHYVVRTAARSPLLTIVGCRPAELEDNHDLSRALAALRRRHVVDEIRLGPLDEDAMRALVTSTAASALHERLLRDSAGNPLVALEMARGGAAEGDVPRSLAELVLSRLASLSAEARALVRWAAIFEHGSLDALEAASADEIGEPVGALETAMRYRLLRFDRAADGRGSFAMEHALIGRVVYESISPVRRAAMHRRVAEVVGRDARGADRTSVVAYHATRADRADLAARALVVGAERCATMGAVQEASDLADRALELVRGLEPETALPLELDALVVLSQVRRPEELAPFVSRLTEVGLRALELDRPEDARRAFHAASRLRWDAGASSEGYGLARKAWHASRGGDAAQRARGTSFMALCLALMEKELPDALAMVHEAEALGRSQGHAEPAELALARGLLHFHAGRLDDARRDAEDATMLARMERSTVREAAALELTMQIELVAGRLDAAVAAASALTELTTRMREGGEGARGVAVLALCRATLAEARPGLAEALERLRDLDDKRRVAWVANRWARWERREGNRDRARELAETALRAARAVEAQSEAAIAACELMATAADEDHTYGRTEDVLAELESGSTLSREARTWVDHG